MSGYGLILPELLLLIGAAWAMFADHLPGGDRGAAWFGALMALGAAALAALAPVGAELFGGLVGFDGAVRFARTGIALLAALWLLWTAGRGEGRIREAVALAMFSVIGAMIMTEANELITLVLGLELATMPAYALMGYRKHRVRGLEGALKYFLLSMLTSLVMLYGMSFLYGVTGTTRYGQFDLTAAGTLGMLAVLLSFVGLFAKLSAAPFHFWAPDAYEGAEAWSVAFVSTVPKLGGAVAIARLTAALAPTAPLLGTALLVVSVVSIVLGNLAALTQTDVRRMMAYSGVAHTGYLLLGVATLTQAGLGAAVLYALAYSVPSLGIMLLVAEEGPAVLDFGGLGSRRPAAAWALVLMAVSLIGIPPMIGFFGKLYLFSAAISAGLAVWVVVAVTMSVVSAGYYLRLVRSAFFGEPTEEKAALPAAPSAAVAIGACAALVVGLGLAAGPLIASLGAPLP